MRIEMDDGPRGDQPNGTGRLRLKVPGRGLLPPPPPVGGGATCVGGREVAFLHFYIYIFRFIFTFFIYFTGMSRVSVSSKSMKRRFSSRWQCFLVSGLIYFIPSERFIFSFSLDIIIFKSHDRTPRHRLGPSVGVWLVADGLPPADSVRGCGWSATSVVTVARLWSSGLSSGLPAPLSLARPSPSSLASSMRTAGHFG